MLHWIQHILWFLKHRHLFGLKIMQMHSNNFEICTGISFDALNTLTVFFLFMLSVRIRSPFSLVRVFHIASSSEAKSVCANANIHGKETNKNWSDAVARVKWSTWLNLCLSFTHDVSMHPYQLAHLERNEHSRTRHFTLTSCIFFSVLWPFAFAQLHKVWTLYTQTYFVATGKENYTHKLQGQTRSDHMDKLNRQLV